MENTTVTSHLPNYSIRNSKTQVKSVLNMKRIVSLITYLNINSDLLDDYQIYWLISMEKVYWFLGWPALFYPLILLPSTGRTTILTTISRLHFTSSIKLHPSNRIPHIRLKKPIYSLQPLAPSSRK